MIEFDFDNIISKLMAEKILSIIKEKKRIKAIEIANILGTDRKTVNHYLYSDLRSVVEKDQMHYWSLKGRRPKLSSDDVYYLTEYIPKRLWRYKEEEELEDSKLVLRLKENDEEAIDVVKERMLDAAEELIDFDECWLVVATVPSSKADKESPMLTVAAYIRDYFNSSDDEEDSVLEFLDMFSRITDVSVERRILSGIGDGLFSGKIA